MAILGYNTPGASEDDATTANVAVRFTAPSSGIVNSYSIYTRFTGVGGDTLQLALCASDLTKPTTRLEMVTQAVAQNTGAPALITIAAGGAQAIVGGTEYWLAVGCVGANGGPKTLYDAGSTDQLAFITSSPSIANPFGTPSGTAALKYSIYLTYTPSGSTATAEPRKAISRIPMRPGPGGFSHTAAPFRFSTSNPVTAPAPVPPAADTPRPFQMVIPMRPTAGGFAVGTPFTFRRSTTPPATAATYTLTAVAGTFTVTGLPAGMQRNYTLTAAAGAFALTGIAAGLRATRTLGASAGSFAVTGNAASLLVGRKLTAAAGAFAVTGQAAGLLRSLVLGAGTGTFTMTGNAATLSRTRSLAATAGTFTVTGMDATLVYSGAAPAATGDSILLRRRRR